MRSSLETQTGPTGGPALHIRASGNGDTGANRIYAKTASLFELTATAAGLRFTVRTGNESADLCPNLVGEFNVSNLLAVIGTLGVGTYNALQYLALQTSSPLNVTLIGSSVPVWMMIVGRIGFGQALHARQLVGAALSVLGVMLVMAHGDLAVLSGLRLVPGDMLMLLASLAWAIYSWLLAHPPAHMVGERRPAWDWATFLFVQVVFGSVWAVACSGVEAVHAGEGSRVWDAEGVEYLDLFPGWGCNLLGHCPEPVVRAVQDQLAKLIHVPNTWYTEPQGEWAQLLSERSFGGQAFFCNSGTEANEAAIKLVRLRTDGRRYKIITFKGGFHGRTMGSVSATAQPKYHEGLGPMVAGFQYAPHGDLAAVEKLVDEHTGGILVEPILGEGGVVPAPEGFLQGLRRIADERDETLRDGAPLRDVARRRLIHRLRLIEHDHEVEGRELSPHRRRCARATVVEPRAAARASRKNRFTASSSRANSFASTLIATSRFSRVSVAR